MSINRSVDGLQEGRAQHILQLYLSVRRVRHDLVNKYTKHYKQSEALRIGVRLSGKGFSLLNAILSFVCPYFDFRYLTLSPSF